MPQVDAVLLDLGNVLAFHDNALLCRRLAEHVGTVPDALVEAFSSIEGGLAELINRGALDPEGIRREVSRTLNGDISMSDFERLFSSHFTVHEAVLPRVERLCAQVPVVLLSNTNALHWAFLRPRLPVLERFRAHCLSHERGLVKPEPAFYLAACEMAGVAPERCAFFADIPKYVEAADSLGIRGRLFTTAESFDAQLRALGL